ncbi:hypothetical protein [Haemophilus influenzae]|nr:hypothetical protein [Haemophilus influenzae]MCK9647911.1 hypothetical protein [Haemophilus influenzae]
MFRILFAVTLLLAAYELNLNQDCDGYICETPSLITALHKSLDSAH